MAILESKASDSCGRECISGGFWPGRIQSAGVTFLAGPPQEGRRGIEQDVTARITRGAPWPDLGGARPPIGNVLLSGREDYWHFRKELREGGVDLSRISIIKNKFAPSLLTTWDRKIFQMGGASLVVVDLWSLRQLIGRTPLGGRRFEHKPNNDACHRQIEAIDRWSRNRGIPVILDVCYMSGLEDVEKVAEELRTIIPWGVSASINVVTNHGRLRGIRVMNSFAPDGSEAPPLWFSHRTDLWAINWWKADESAEEYIPLIENVPPLPGPKRTSQVRWPAGRPGLVPVWC